jgi:hypothetical protein
MNFSIDEMEMKHKRTFDLEKGIAELNKENEALGFKKKLGKQGQKGCREHTVLSLP